MPRRRDEGKEVLWVVCLLTELFGESDDLVSMTHNSEARGTHLRSKSLASLASPAHHLGLAKTTTIILLASFRQNEIIELLPVALSKIFSLLYLLNNLGFLFGN